MEVGGCFSQFVFHFSVLHWSVGVYLRYLGLRHLSCHEAFPQHTEKLLRGLDKNMLNTRHVCVPPEMSAVNMETQRDHEAQKRLRVSL